MPWIFIAVCNESKKLFQEDELPETAFYIGDSFPGSQFELKKLSGVLIFALSVENLFFVHTIVDIGDTCADSTKACCNTKNDSNTGCDHENFLL